MTTFTLNTGAKIPAVAFGTYGAEDKEIYDAVTCALKEGYRHLDCAYYYKNEAPVGKAIRDSGIPREEIFVTTKMWPTQAHDPAAALETSLKNLGLDYVDLYLVHWPYVAKSNPPGAPTMDVETVKDIDYVKVWSTFQDLPKSKAKAVGVSNMTTTKLITLLAAESTHVVPAVNQVELHPELPQERLVQYCKSQNIICEAYSPLAQGQVNNPTVKEIAEKHNVDPGQVVLSWNVQRGVVVLPKSVTPKRIASNLKTVKLDDGDMKKLTALGTKQWRRLVRPDKVFGDDVYENDVDCQPVVA